MLLHGLTLPVAIAEAALAQVFSDLQYDVECMRTAVSTTNTLLHRRNTEIAFAHVLSPGDGVGTVRLQLPLCLSRFVLHSAFGRAHAHMLPGVASLTGPT